MSKIKNIRHAACWRKNEIPERFHYNDSPRIAPVVCLTEQGWQLTNRKRYEDRIKSTDINQLHGSHGYDNQLESMRATFIAHGAAFKKGYVVESFENIEVYNLMCRILGLTPARNDGNFERVKHLLK
jgi:predicted AlkP superfamily pyrophosphatase or phosphodiesterase